MVKKIHQSPSGGLNSKGRAYYKKKGHNLKKPVTSAAPKGKAKARKKSFCARMSGMKRKLTGNKKSNDPNSRINKALKKWKC